MAWVRSEDGWQARVGGWGFAFGDERGGYDLGSPRSRRGLAATSRAADGRGPDTELLPAALRHFGVDAVGEIVRELTDDLSKLRRATAAFAVAVLDAARRDTVAVELMDDAGAELARRVATVRDQLAAARPGARPDLTGIGQGAARVVDTPRDSPTARRRFSDARSPSGSYRTRESTAALDHGRPPAGTSDRRLLLGPREGQGT